MPLETISCSHCGSAEVKEVKANTYFCDHCETVFKRTDPSQVTLQRDFCICGNTVDRRCLHCGVGLCNSCDHSLSQYWYRQAGRLGVTASAVLQLYSVDVRAEALARPPQHMCEDCRANLAQDLESKRRAGEICSAACILDASVTCLCCERRYCERHGPAAREGTWHGASDPGVGKQTTIGVRIVELERTGYGDREYEVGSDELKALLGEVPQPAIRPEVCWLCIEEYHGQAYLTVRVRKRRLGRRQILKQALEEANRLTEGMSTQWRLQLADGTCPGRHPSSKATHSSRWVPSDGAVAAALTQSEGRKAVG
jgi:hypothetical protein